MKNQNATMNVGEMFSHLFNSIRCTLSFNKNWHAPNGRLTGLLTHEKYRLIMLPGQVARMSDNFKRKIIFMGTPTGTVVLYQNTPGVLGATSAICSETANEKLEVQYNKKVSIPMMDQYSKTVRAALLEKEQAEKKAATPDPYLEQMNTLQTRMEEDNDVAGQKAVEEEFKAVAEAEKELQQPAKSLRGNHSSIFKIDELSFTTVETPVVLSAIDNVTSADLKEYTDTQQKHLEEKAEV